MPSEVNSPTVRAAIYARYSSDNQREASIEDQVEVCRRLRRPPGLGGRRGLPRPCAERGEPVPAGVRADAGRCGSAPVDVILVEALDRLGRKLADVSDLHDRLTFFGIGLHAVATGEVTAMHVGMLGTMAQMYLKDLAEKTKRGQLGRALKGKIPGGKAYGYDVLPAGADGAGGRSINPAEAAVVRRVFELFAAGVSPRAIAKRLNAEGSTGTGRARLARHHNPRSGRSRHWHPQQRALCRPAGVEPLLVRQGPAHGQKSRPAEPARAVGDRAGA